jgi:hypothetical protein
LGNKKNANTTGPELADLIAYLVSNGQTYIFIEGPQANEYAVGFDKPIAEYVHELLSCYLNNKNLGRLRVGKNIRAEGPVEHKVIVHIREPIENLSVL